MKKIVLCLGLLLICLFTIFCGTNEYYIRTYSSNYETSKTPLSKGSSLLIMVDGLDFFFSRPFELELSNLLEKEGMKVYVLSDYNYLNSDGSVNEDVMYNVITTLVPDYMMGIEVSDVYTFTTGGGISTMKLSTYLLNSKNNYLWEKMTIQMTSVVEGTNNFEQYYSSQDSVIKKLSENIVNELKKYISK